MSTALPKPASKWPGRTGATAGFVAAFTLLALALAGPGYRAGLLGLMPAFNVLMASAVGAALALLVGLIAVVLNWRRGTQGMLVISVIAALVGLSLCINNLTWFRKGRAVPPIHDISTDLVSPPMFQAIALLRADAPNPAEYAGEEVAEQQRGAYPDIVPLMLDQDPDTVFSAARAVAESMGWEIAAADAEAGRIEATDTTAYFGFKDDVVIRISAEPTGSRLDIRSKSRVGLSDVGTNAQRIRDFRETLSAQL
jgi:uncharacterized protein (DUF1499 family)